MSLIVHIDQPKTHLTPTLFTWLKDLLFSAVRWLKDIGFGTILGIVGLLAISRLLFGPFLEDVSQLIASSDPLALSLKLGIVLILFGVVLLWAIYPLVGPSRLEPLAHKAAYLCVLCGLTILLLAIVSTIISRFIQ